MKHVNDLEVIVSNPEWAMSASVILVQLPEGERISAFVGLGTDEEGKRLEFELKPCLDTSNRRAWLSEVLSSLLEQV